MIINRLVMHNFGVYAGTNTIELNNRKPIVLIGGMNGRGKTTFLEAILIALYGAKSFAYKESKYNSYGKYLKSYVNNNDKSKTSYVELEFSIDLEEEKKYIVRREWDALHERTRETITVWENGKINSFLTNNWAMFVENLIPSALSNFFFFDGEKIAELAVDDSDQQMKASIRSMLGISILDVLKNDLLRNLHRASENIEGVETYEELQKLRKNRDQAADNLAEVDRKIDGFLEEENTIIKTLEELHHDYEAKGGDIVQSRQSYIKKKSELMAEQLQIEADLQDLASDVLPLYLVKDLIFNIKEQAKMEQEDTVTQLAMKQIKNFFSDYVKDKENSNDGSREFVNFIEKQVAQLHVNRIYDLSNHTCLQLEQFNHKSIAQNLDIIQSSILRKSKIQKEIDEVDSHLSLDINEKALNEIYNKIKNTESRLLTIQKELEVLQHDRVVLNSAAISATSDFNKYVENYLLTAETKDDAERKIKYINMALRILEEYTVELQKQKTGLLAVTITDCYKKLANKRNMIEKIEMDSKTLDMTYLDDLGNVVLKDSLSAGEKQLMVIAILWALAICSKKKLPVIIDTPLSRLDSQHRKAIITTYFPNASDQTIILSTDTEIDQTYYELIKDNVGDEFTLNYNEETKSTTVQKGYFR